MTSDIKSLAKFYGFDDAFLLPILDCDSKLYRSLVSAYSVMPNAKSVLLLVMRHSPFTDFPKTSMIVHSHYPAHQKAYSAHKKMIEHFQNQGISATSGNMLPLKQYALSAGLVRLRNSLVYHNEHGSYISLQAIILNVALEDSFTIQKVDSDICKDCDRCVKGCPTSAISKYGVVDIEKCLRHHIPVRENISDDIKKLSQRSYIGCGVCQLVCPLNDKIEKVSPPDELVKALDISGILDNDKQQMRALSDIIGKNEVRAGRSIATACLAAGSTRDKRYLPQLYEIANNHPNPLPKEYAKWAIEQILK